MFRPTLILTGAAFAGFVVGCSPPEREVAKPQIGHEEGAAELPKAAPELTEPSEEETGELPQSQPPTPSTETAEPPMDTPLGKVLALADAGKDPAWRTEKFTELAGAQLSKIGDVLAGEAAPEILASISAPDFASSSLVVDTVEAFADHSFTVSRGHEFQEPVPGDLATSVKSLAKRLGAARTKFKIIAVEPGEASYGAVARAGFAGEASEINAIWKMTWVRGESGAAPLLRSVKLTEFEEVKRTAEQPLFVDCTEAVIGDTTAYREQLVYGAPHWHGNLDLAFGIFQGNQGLAIGDANGDGLDDLYLCQPDGLPNRFFLRRPDGTLAEHTTESGVDLLDVSRSPLFVDFDNDGDQDLAVSHRFAVSFFENLGAARYQLRQTFQADSRSSGISVADYDLDGDLDLYLCGYSPQSQTSPEDIFANPVPYEDATNGAFNYLLRNDGGFKFTDATEGSGFDQNNTSYSFAAAWEDYDNDGDQDLYVANDFGRNNLFRNELVPSGKPTFTDVAESLGVVDVAAGMSADWGDADNDGRMDLYISNMWSSAGHRIAGQDHFKRDADKGTRALIKRHARGNSLFTNRGDGFDDRSVASNVNMGRWAWGSLFVDLNNDGWEDFYIANGFMSAPATGDL